MFTFIFNNKKKSEFAQDEGLFLFLSEELSMGLIFGDILITYKKKKMECSSEFFNLIPIDLAQIYNGTY